MNHLLVYLLSVVHAYVIGGVTKCTYGQETTNHFMKKVFQPLLVTTVCFLAFIKCMQMFLTCISLLYQMCYQV